MNSPLVSIIVPVYNSENWLIFCLNSILNQSYQNIEVIVVDDGSKDNSAYICDSFGKKDSRIKVIHKKNAGVSSARNCGIDCAKGEYIQFVDSDDIIHPQMTEKLVEIIEEKNAEIAMCDFLIIQENEMDKYIFTGIGKVNSGEMSRKEALKNIITNVGFRGFPVNKLFRKNILNSKKEIRFDPQISICEDLLFCCEYLSNIDNIVYINEKLYGYVEHSGSALKKIDEKFLTSIDAKRKIAEIYEEHCLPEGRSYYIYLIAYLFTFINSKVIKERKKQLKTELKEKKEWFIPKVHTQKERILFSLICIAPCFWGRMFALMRKLRKK